MTNFYNIYQNYEIFQIDTGTWMQHVGRKKDGVTELNFLENAF
jgi:hypothetical protein